MPLVFTASAFAFAGCTAATDHSGTASRSGLETCLASQLATLPADDYDVMGTVEVFVDGAPLTLWVPFDREEQLPYATRMTAGAMTLYTIDAFSGTPGEDIDTPRLSLSFSIAGAIMPIGDLSYVAGRSDAAVYGAGGAGDEAGTLSLDNVTVDGDTVAVRFNADAVELDRTDYEPKDGGDMITLTGKARVTFPD